MQEPTRHWSEDSYWTDALQRYYKLRDSGQTRIEVDILSVEELIFSAESPAYKLMDAMYSVQTMEGYEGYRGAPRLILGIACNS